MVVLYDLAFVVFALFYLPVLLFKRKLHRGFVQRLGFLPPNPNLGRLIWIHAVSVGEAKVAETLLRQLRRIYPEKSFAISCVTPTGARVVRSFRQEGDFVFYLPLDISFIVRKVIRIVRPCACVIIETEIWPNLITQLNKAKVPVVLVNARISDASFGGYRIIKFMIKDILDKVSLFCAQTQRDAQRLSALGVAFDKLRITGNMKFDASEDYADFEKDRLDYKLKLGLKDEERLFIAGSTHPGEEEIILNAYRKLLSEFPDLRLLLAPRHPERSPQVVDLAASFNFMPLRVSQLTLPLNSSGQAPIFILDTVGQLVYFYAAADIVFVGGSLVKKGGHNILEPAYSKKAIICGPHMFNFRDISDLFLRHKAARRVRSQEELFAAARFLLNNPKELKAMGEAARRLILRNRGATQRNLELIRRLLC